MSHVLRVFGVAVLFGCFVSAVSAQDASKSQSAAPAAPATQVAAVPAANPADVSSVDAIMAATYDVISGPPTKKRDWDRFRSLFVPGCATDSGRARQGRFRDFQGRGHYPGRIRKIGRCVFLEKRICGTRDLPEVGTVRKHHADFQHLRIAARCERCEAVRARDQQLSIVVRRQALVGGDDLLAGRRRGKSAAEGIPSRGGSRFLICFDLRSRKRERSAILISVWPGRSRA